MTRWMEAGNRRKEDSGLIDLDALMRQANASAAAEDSGERPIVEVEKKETLLAPPPPPLESTPALVAPIHPSSKQRSWSRPLVASGLALALFGAGLYGYTRGSAGRAPTPVAVVTPREPAAASPRPLENVRGEDPSSAAPSANDLPSVASALPSALPSATPPSTAKHAAPAKQADAVVSTTELIPESPAQGSDLGRAMHDAVGEGSSRVAKVEATQGNGARTLRPSPGAVIGALNAVLPAARACLGPDDAIRAGTVTFRSDGRVAKVELNGKRDSDDCIRGAVTRARVEPFADDTFTTRITVRP